MLNITKFAEVIENFGFLIKTIYMCGADIVIVELLGIKTINTLFILMPPELTLAAADRGKYEIINVSKIPEPVVEYSSYLTHLEQYNNSGVFSLGFKHENIFTFNNTVFSSDNAPGLSNGLLIFINFKNLCEDMTFLNRELDVLRKHVYKKANDYVVKMSSIEFIQKDLCTILERIARYDELYFKYNKLYERAQKVSGDAESLISHKDTVIGEILYIKDLRENLIISTDILLCEIENNHCNIKHVSMRLKELF